MKNGIGNGYQLVLPHTIIDTILFVNQCCPVQFVWQSTYSSVKALGLPVSVCSVYSLFVSLSTWRLSEESQATPQKKKKGGLRYWVSLRLILCVWIGVIIRDFIRKAEKNQGFVRAISGQALHKEEED